MTHLINRDIDETFKHLWQEIRGNGPGEPNLYDLRLMAQILRLHYVDKIPQDIPNCAVGLKIIEYIEDNIFKDTPTYKIHHTIRKLSLEDFSKRLREIAKGLQLKGYLHGGITKTLCVGFYTWYGCIFMAKLTRAEDSCHTKYTPEMRREGYGQIKEEWEDAEKFGNPWIKFGITLAKMLEEKRKKSSPSKIIADEWVPKSSPYWKCFNGVNVRMAT